MANKKLSEYPLVCVIWDDAHMSMDEYTVEDITKLVHRPEQVKSFGLLIQQDEKGVTLSNDEGMTDGQLRHVIFIPKGMIVEVVNLGLPTRKMKRAKKLGAGEA